MNPPLNRRTFLRTTGVALALPWLEKMNPVHGREIPTPPKRMVFICTALGLHSPALWPKTTGENYESTEYLELLKDHRSNFTLFSGLSHPDQGGEHSTEMTWLSAARNPLQDGFRNSISIDQYAAGRLGYVTRFPSIVLSSEGPRSQSYSSGGVMVPAESSPSRIFTKMFLQGNKAEVEKQKRKLREGRSILDELLNQTKPLLNSVSADDKKRLEEYFESVRDAERQLAEAQQWHQKPKPKVEEPTPNDIFDKSDLVGRIGLLMNLIPLITQTDSSRVVAVMIQDHQVVPQIDGVTLEHHNLSHHGRDDSKIQQLKTIEKEIIIRFGDLLAQMKAKQEGSATLLDNTSILFGSNLGNANAHDPRNNPVFLAGGGYQHGHYIAHDNSNNTPLCNLFVNMLNNSDIETEAFATSTGELRF